MLSSGSFPYFIYDPSVFLLCVVQNKIILVIVKKIIVEKLINIVNVTSFLEDEKEDEDGNDEEKDGISIG